MKHQKSITLWVVGESFERGAYVYPMKCYENAVESEVSSSSNVFRSEKEAEERAEAIEKAKGAQ